MPMKMLKRSPTCLAFGFVLFGTISQTDPALAAPYTLTVLPFLSGGNFLVAEDINNHGQVTGFGYTSNGSARVFVWDAAQGMQVLPNPTNDSFVANLGWGINDAGQVVGSAVTPSLGAFRWDPTNGYAFAGDLPGNQTNSKGLGINSSGTIVGDSSATTGTRAFRWDQTNGMIDLGDLPGGSNISSAYKINDVGQVVGDSDAASGTRAFRWDETNGMVDLGDLPGGGDFSNAKDINNLGQVVGLSNMSTGQRGFLCDQMSGMQDLGELAGGIDQSVALGINDHGIVVGRSHSNLGNRAVLWDAAQSIVDLNTLIGPAALTFTLYQADAINNFGMIIGIGLESNGTQRAFVLTPSSAAAPAPGALGLLGFGSLLFFGYRHRRAALTG